MATPAIDVASIDWTNTKSAISLHFTVHEATWLPSWGVHHVPSDEEKAAICTTAAWMDEVRARLGRPINVHVWIRPGRLNCPGFDPSTITPHNPAQAAALAALDYNAFIGGASHSAHRLGRAVDFDAGDRTGAGCDAVRSELEPQLEELGLRMERKPGGDWIHLDDMPVTGTRYFIP